MSTKKIMCIIFGFIMLMMGVQPAFANDTVSLTATSESITAYNTPPGSTLITALYSDETLIDVKMYNGTDNITANFKNDMNNSLDNATVIKAFLWDMKILKPLCPNINALISLLPTTPPEVTPTPTSKNKTLVVYFSCTNTTEGIANHILNAVEANKYEIEAATPYTEDDLKYYTNCRADKEQNDPTARPEIAGSISNIEDYDTIFLGYPIWHGQAPKIIYTFLESYNFSGKTIVPFCTSHSSGVGSSATNLHSICKGDNVVWKTGTRFSSSSSSGNVVSWINSLNLDIEMK